MQSLLSDPAIGLQAAHGFGIILRDHDYALRPETFANIRFVYLFIFIYLFMYIFSPFFLYFTFFFFTFFFHPFFFFLYFLSFHVSLLTAASSFFLFFFPSSFRHFTCFFFTFSFPFCYIFLCHFVFICVYRFENITCWVRTSKDVIKSCTKSHYKDKLLMQVINLERIQLISLSLVKQ